MRTLILTSSPTAQWYALVNEAQLECQFQLSEDFESYLVFLLMRFSSRSDFTSNVLALEYLNSMLSEGHIRKERLRDVGDQCLLFSGLFPQVAQKRSVKISYYVNIGRTAYSQIGDIFRDADLFKGLSMCFVQMMDVLQVIGEMRQNEPLLEPLIALELWQDTGSQKALNTVKAATQANIMPNKSNTLN